MKTKNFSYKDVRCTLQKAPGGKMNLYRAWDEDGFQLVYALSLKELKTKINKAEFQKGPTAFQRRSILTHQRKNR